MRRRFLCALCALFLLTCTAFAQSGDYDEGLYVMTLPEARGMSVNAAAAIVVEARTGRILFAQNADERLPIASTTKIMTALITLEQPDIDAVFTVDPEAIKVEGSSMGLLEGDQASLRTLAVGMLLASGNDAANAAAVRISGSVPAFVELMNKRAKDMGLVNTSFETPSGLDGEAHYSTAADLATLARQALRNDAFRSICSQYKMRASYGNPPYERWLTNHNKLLNYYEGTIGVKTGFTKKAGRCLVTAAERDGVELICVTLDCGDDWNVHKGLYNTLFPRIQIEDLAKSIPAVSVPVTGGTTASVAAVNYDKAQVAIPASGADVQYSITIQPFLYAPVTSGQPLGEACITVDGQHVSTLTLVAANDVPLLHPYEEKISLWDRVKGFFEKG